MSKAVIFNGVNSLDFEELRRNAVRIPEVISRLRRAQSIWDHSGFPSFDFVNFIGSEDKVFLSNIKYKSLAAAIVQVGLFDRFVRLNEYPQYLVGDIRQDRSVQVCLGLISFEELILKSTLVRSIKKDVDSVNADQNLPYLSGIQLSEMRVYKCKAKKNLVEYEEVEIHSSSLTQIIRHLVDNNKVKEFINVGPGTRLPHIRHEFEMEDLAFSESVDMDPMLGWFWTHIVPNHMQIAQ